MDGKQVKSYLSTILMVMTINKNLSTYIIINFRVNVLWLFVRVSKQRQYNHKNKIIKNFLVLIFVTQILREKFG